jgi:hypothetical protein
MNIRCLLGKHDMFVQSVQKMLRTRDYNQYGWTTRYVFKKESNKEQEPVTRVNSACRRCNRRVFRYEEGWQE